jgi:signal transduction histidine kinase
VTRGPHPRRLAPARGTAAAGTTGRGDPDESLFDGPGEMRARCRAFDWATTPLGPVDAWRQDLRTTAATVLATGFPAILLWGADLIQVYNDAYIRFLGVKHPNALGMPTYVCWPEVRFITEPIYARVFAGETVMNEEQQYSLHNAGPHAPPEDVYVTISFAPVGEPGAVSGVLVTIIDVTHQVANRRLQEERERLLSALKVEEERLAEIFRRAPNFIAMLRGPDQTYAFINEAYSQIIGHRDVVGKPLLDALPEVRGQGFKELLDRVRDTGEPWIGRETPVLLQRVPGAPPETRYLDMVFRAFVEADGTHSGVVAHGSDVTDQVLARRELEQANARLRQNAADLERQAEELKMTSELRVRVAEAEAANRGKMEFLAVMSHELRTPLNAIGGYTELLNLGIHGPVTADQHLALDRIQRSQRHLLGLINEVLNYAKIDAGAVTYASEPVVIAHVLRTCEALVMPQMHAKRLQFRSATVDDALVARADGEKVQQIMINLLSNATKFTEAGGTITVTCGVSPGGISISVADTGRGIPSDQLGRVFEPFVQVDARFTRTQEGVGLGLAISRDLARGMGGDLVAESALDVGSVFTLTLPGNQRGTLSVTD